VGQFEGRRLANYDGGMDLNRLAKRIVSESTGETPREPDSQQAEAGRKGGVKGGKSRAAKLSAKRRSEIAQKAARARWQSS
jgi:hypothetical protein